MQALGISTERLVPKFKTPDRKKDWSFYVSWIARGDDPWPLWRDVVDRDVTVRDEEFVFTGADDDQWPLIAHKIERDGFQHLHLGPTLSALFHPNSPYCNFRDLDVIYLLTRKHESNSGEKPEVLLGVMERICRARALDFSKVRLVEMENIERPVNHTEIMDELRKWQEDKPFNPKPSRKMKNPYRRVVVNLGPGTATMHACWLLAYFNRMFGTPPETQVTFIQGDGGFRVTPYESEEARQPVHVVPVEEKLSQLVQFEKPAPETPVPVETEVNPEDWESELYRSVLDRIRQAALLGLPIILYGERGTGKTYLARYYHRCRCAARREGFSRSSTIQPLNERERWPEGFKPKASWEDRNVEARFITVTLSEYDFERLHSDLFGWTKGSFTDAGKDYDGLLGQAHDGTLFLDEIHHLDFKLQSLLLAVLNNKRYKPRGEGKEVVIEFDLAVATNDPQWRKALAEDFRDRIERIVLELPSFRELRRQPEGMRDLWQFWNHVLRRRCAECNVTIEENTFTEECREKLSGIFQHNPLKGNWRDLMRLADQILLRMATRGSSARIPLQWQPDLLDDAIRETFPE